MVWSHCYIGSDKVMPESGIIAATVANSNHEVIRRERREIISRRLEKAVYQLNHPYYLSQYDRLRQIISKCISFPKINNSNGNENNGKPHDVETHTSNPRGYETKT